MKASTSISRDNLLHVGTCMGKFTKSGKFRLHITALEYIAQYAKVRFGLWSSLERASLCLYLLFLPYLSMFISASVQSLGETFL